MRIDKLNFTFILSFLFFSLATFAHGDRDFLFDDLSSVAEDRELLKALKYSQGLKVMWWNIKSGAGPGVNHNLQVLLERAYEPDVLFLSEYKRGTLDGETENLLAQRYYRKQFFAYNSQIESGMMAFSKLPFEEIYLADRINWDTSRSVDPVWAEIFKNREEAVTRSYQRLKLIFRGKILNIVPVHLGQPWDKLVELKSKKFILKEMFFGAQNPFQLQVEKLLESAFTDFYGVGERGLLVGDLNLFRPMRAYFTILKSWKDSFFWRFFHTFPALSDPLRKVIPPIRIDHHFRTKGVKFLLGGAPRLKGSDHYPIFASYELD